MLSPHPLLSLTAGQYPHPSLRPWPRRGADRVSLFPQNPRSVFPPLLSTLTRRGTPRAREGLTPNPLPFPATCSAGHWCSRPIYLPVQTATAVTEFNSFHPSKGLSGLFSPPGPPPPRPKAPLRTAAGSPATGVQCRALSAPLRTEPAS